MPNLVWKGALPHRESLQVPSVPVSDFDPSRWTCSVCGKTRPRDLLHSKAILGQPALVCAPSCLGAERRARGR
jgi:hypothetical protein